MFQLLQLLTFIIISLNGVLAETSSYCPEATNIRYPFRYQINDGAIALPCLENNNNNNNRNTSKRSYAFVQDNIPKGLNWYRNCEESVEYNSTGASRCHCDNGEFRDRICPQTHPGSKVMIGVSTGVGVLCLILLVIYGRTAPSSLYLVISHWRNGNKSPTNVEVFLENYGCLALQTYKYSDIKKMTNSFKDTLGQGGYGCVFKCKLRDDHLVAVKVLKDSKQNGEEFINEVATIGRTNHVHVVGLLGFCSEGTKRALVYEFMSNGYLERFIYNENNSSTTTPPLGWEKLYTT
ncbi:hypothetical protein IFM89_005893 [Coptis chinensis]|uniref:non-specific serine/threonine protein kinase n=1 Tax=Coptis chinensis TaxID=261450 RepID=A0A835LTH8_9MAGN|nr:hypothetical protein IFM89_005893 [Coptis chinensis]